MAFYQTLTTYFQTYGLLDFILPFILVFTIVFAVMQKSKILGDNKQFNVVIALVLGLLFVAPHVMGTYPLGYDPVDVLNESLPSISLVSIAAIMMLLLLGIFGQKFAETAKPWIALFSIGFVVYIFGASLDWWTGPYNMFYWWTPQLTELLVVIAVFGVIVYYITKKPDDKASVTGAFKDTFSGIGGLLKEVDEKKKDK
jgi:hypothetical protein